MPPVNPAAAPSSASRTAEFYDISNQEEQDIWFDAIDWVEMDETWFDASDSQYADPAAAGEAADSRVPFTEDCRRGVQQFVRTLGKYGEGRLLTVILSALNGTPLDGRAMAVNSLYFAITEGRNIDTAVHTLGLASWFLPDNINFISCTAAFIRDTITGWADDTFLQHFLGSEDSPLYSNLFTALAVATVVARCWMKDEGAPQRAILKVPAFMANLFLRVGHYWTALGNVPHSVLQPGGQAGVAPAPPEQAPAFEVDTRVNMAWDRCKDNIACPPQIANFSLDSTSRVNPEALIQKTFWQKTLWKTPASAAKDNYCLPVPEQSHFLAVDKFRQENGLSDLLNCATRKTETPLRTDGKVITTTYLNTKCDATTYPESPRETAESTPVHADAPENQAASAATDRRNGDTLLPLVATAVAVPVATSYMQALKSKTFMAAGAVSGLTVLTVGGKLLWDKLSSHNHELQFQYRLEFSNTRKEKFNENLTLIDLLVYEKKAKLYTLPTDHLPTPDEDNIVFDYQTGKFLLKTQYGFIEVSGPLNGNRNAFFDTLNGKVEVIYDSDEKSCILKNIDSLVVGEFLSGIMDLTTYNAEARVKLTNLMKRSIQFTPSQKYFDILIDFYRRIKNHHTQDNSIKNALLELTEYTCLKILSSFQGRISNSFDCKSGYVIREPDFNFFDYYMDAGLLIKEFFAGAGISNSDNKIKLSDNEYILKIGDDHFLFERYGPFNGEIKITNGGGVMLKYHPRTGWAGGENCLSEKTTDLVKKHFLPFLDNYSEILPELQKLINSSIRDNESHRYSNFLKLFKSNLVKYITDLDLSNNREREQIALLMILIKLEERNSLINGAPDNVFIRCVELFDSKLKKKFQLLIETMTDTSLYNEAISTKFNEINSFNNIRNRINQASAEMERTQSLVSLFNTLKKREVNAIPRYYVQSVRPFKSSVDLSATGKISAAEARWDVKIKDKESELRVIKQKIDSLKKKESIQIKHFAIIKQTINEFKTLRTSDKKDLIFFDAYSSKLHFLNNPENEIDEEELRNLYRILHYQTLVYFDEIYKVIITCVQDSEVSWRDNKNILDINIARQNAAKVINRIYPRITGNHRGYLFDFISSYILYKHDQKNDNHNFLDVITYFNEKKEKYLEEVLFTDATNQSGHTTISDFLPRSFFSSRKQYTDQFNDYLDSKSLDYDAKFFSNLIIYNADNLIVEDLLLPPKRVAYYKYSGGELTRHYGKDDYPVIGFYGVIECNSGNYLLIKSSFGYIQANYLKKEELMREFSLNSNNQFEFEREYSAIVRGDVFGATNFIKTDRNKLYETIIHRDNYFQEFHGKQFNKLKDAIFALAKKYLTYTIDNYKESMDEQSFFTKVAGYTIPFFSELYGALTDRHHKFDTDSIILDFFSITSVLTSSGLKIAKLSIQEIEKIAHVSFYYRNLGVRGYKLASLVLSDVGKMSIPITKLSISQVKMLISDMADPIGITNFMKIGNNGKGFELLNLKKDSSDFYANLYNFARPVTGKVTDSGYKISNGNGVFKARFDPSINSYRLINSYEFDVALQLKKGQWEVNYEIYSRERLEYLDKINTNSFRAKNNILIKEDINYQGPGTSSNARNNLGQRGLIPINKSTGATITRIDLGKDFLLYSSRDEKSVVKPAERVFVTAHGTATILNRKFIIPEDSIVEFLAPHRAKLVSPGVDIINLPYLEPHSEISHTGFIAGGTKPDGSPHTYRDTKSITGLSNPEEGEIRDYNLSFFDGDNEQDIAAAIEYNRNRKHPFVPTTDVVTVKHKLSHELIEPTLSKLIKELKTINHPAKKITVCICRESLSHSAFSYNARRTNRDVSSQQNVIIDVYDYDVNDENLRVVSYWSTVLEAENIELPR